MRALLAVVTWDLDVETLRDTLRETGFRRQTLAYGDLAKRRGTFDVVIQLGLGKDERYKKGLEITKQLHLLLPHAPLVLISGHFMNKKHGDPIAALALEAGASKVLDRGHLGTSLAEWLEALKKQKTAG